MSNCVIFDLSLLLTDERCVWIIDKNKPMKPLLKISNPDFALIKKAIYKRDKHPIVYNGDVYWLPNGIYNVLPTHIDIGLSFAEYIDSDLISGYDIKLNDNVELLKNIKSDIYLVTDRYTSKHGDFLNKIVDELSRKHDIKIKSVISLRKNILDMNSDLIGLYEDVILSFYIGKQIQNNIPVDISMDRYDKVIFIGDNRVRFINMVDKIKYFDVDNIDIKFVVVEVTNNKVNKLMMKKYHIKK